MSESYTCAAHVMIDSDKSFMHTCWHVIIHASPRRRAPERDAVSSRISTVLYSTTRDFALTCRENNFRSFLRCVFPLGVVVRCRYVFAENLTLRPYGQQLLKFFCSWDRKSLEHVVVVFWLAKQSLRSIFELRISEFGVWVKRILTWRRWAFLVHRLIS